MSKWILVKDKQPEELEPVLCYVNGGIFILTLDPCGTWVDYMGEYFGYDPDYWMPLPGAPNV